MMTQREAATAPPQECVDSLVGLLSAERDDYRAMLALIERKSTAIRHAHLDRMEELFEEECRIINRLSEMEARRGELLQQIGEHLTSDGKSKLTVKEIADFLDDETRRTRLLAVAEELREVATETRTRNSKVRAAAEALARHMSGVMQTVRSALSRAGVYEQKGRLAVGAQLDFSIDVRS